MTSPTDAERYAFMRDSFALNSADDEAAMELGSKLVYETDEVGV